MIGNSVMEYQPYKMKRLVDLCLECVGNHLDVIPRAGTFLASVDKETLIERLSCHDLLVPAYLPHVTYNLFSSTLKRVNFYHSEQVTDAVLKLLSSSKCRLRYLTVHLCDNVTDAGVVHITEGQTELQELELIRLTKLTNRALQKVSSPVLDTVSLRGCTFISTEGVKTLVSQNPTISSLCLALCSKLDETAISAVAASLQDTLVDFDLNSVNVVNDAGLLSLAEHCPNLLSLNLLGCNRITELGISKVFQQCRLKKLDLSYCTKVQTTPDNACLRLMPHTLQELSLCGVPITDRNLFVDSVKRLVSLKSVRLCGVSTLSDDTLEEILSVIGEHLEHLDLSGSVMCQLTDTGLASITRHCHNMEDLALSLLRDVTGLTLLPLLRDDSRAQNLGKLMLSCRKLDPEVVHAVAGACCNLQKLDLAGLTYVDDAMVTRIAERCTQLTYINLKGCREVTDLGVCELARHCPLTVAVLSGLHTITDRSIFALANSCPYLEQVFLSGCSHVTRAAVQYLLDTCITRVYFHHQG